MDALKVSKPQTLIPFLFPLIPCLPFPLSPKLSSRQFLGLSLIPLPSFLRMKLFLFALLGLVFVVGSLQAAAPPDDQARFLAGLSVEASELEPLARESAWQEHSTEFHRAWLDLEERQLSKIRLWMPSTLGFIHADPSPLFYTFSGPDFLYANAFYPNAKSYILCGREPVGTLPDVAALNSGARASALRNMRTALNAILSFSFFITADMKTDLNQTQLSGTLPVLYVFLARAGCRITSAELIKLSATGDITTEKSKTPGVKINFIGTTGQAQTLYYFTTDLSNWGIKDNPAFLEFCKKQGPGNGFAKAASYLMHMDEFSTVRDFLLSSTRNMVQDDSGIPFRFFTPDRWMVSVYGNYPGPIDLFKQHFQTDLAAAAKSGAAGELPFGVGYQWRPGVSSLIVSTAYSAVPKAVPVEE